MTISDVCFRQACEGDWPVIKQLVHESSELIKTHLPSHRSFFVAVVGGKVIGCCALAVNIMEDLCEEEKLLGRSPKTAEIRCLAVKARFQRLGIATKLIELCLVRAIERPIYEANTYTNVPGLFERFGFSSFSEQTGKFAMFKVLD